MENGKTTVNDVMTDVKDILSRIRVPASEIESIGIPIAKAINGIQLCLDAFAQEKAAREAQAAEEPEIELVEAEEEPGEEDA